MIKIALQLFLFIFPWSLRRLFLCKLFHFEIAKTAHIGYSIILAHKVILKDYSKIGHLTFCKPIDLLELDEHSNLGTRNFITGFSTKIPNFPHFSHCSNRECVLKIGRHTGITSRHYFDCNGGIYIGDYCQIAGFETAFITHSIDLKENRQDVEKIVIGDFSFIGTRCTFIKGSVIPARSVVAACSLVNKNFETPNSLYGGIPCKFIKSLDGYKFFERAEGSVI